MNSLFGDPKPLAQPGAETTGHRSGIHQLGLVLYPDSILRTVCEPVETFDSTLRDVADEMLSLMHRHAGIGLAAPQVGLRQRLFVASIDNRPFALVKPATPTFALPSGCRSVSRCGWPPAGI